MNTFKLKTEGFDKSISLKVKVKKCDIPSLMLYNSKCIENCVFSSDSDGRADMLEEDSEGFLDKHLVLALKLFLKTIEGQQVFGHFMNYGQTITLAKEDVYTPNCQGDFYNLHSLHFVEKTGSESNGVLADTSISFNTRCNDQPNMSLFKFHTRRKIDVNEYYNNIDKLKKHSKYLYLYVKIQVYMTHFKTTAKEEGWSEERLIAEIAHTIGHELFIHAYRKAIPAMKAFNARDFEAFDEIIQRDTGDKGDYDHITYIRDFKDEGLNLMYSFQKSLKGLIGNNIYNSVLKYHDKKYESIENNKLPDESIKNTEY